MKRNSLSDVILRHLSNAQPEPTERDDILEVLKNMCALGWVAFETDHIYRYLRQRSRRSYAFDGDIVIGIVKLFFGINNDILRGQVLEREVLGRQILTMCLMRRFSWVLREYEHRNWIDSYLVDGGDADVHEMPWILSCYSGFQRH